MRLRTKLRLWWCRLWIRRDEFHSSLGFDVFAMLEMSHDEQDRYIADIVRRRSIAHERDAEKRGNAVRTKAEALKRMTAAYQLGSDYKALHVDRCDVGLVLAALTDTEKLLDEATRRLDLAQSTLSIIEYHPNEANNETARYMSDKAGEARDKDWAAQEGHIMSWKTREHYKRAEQPNNGGAHGRR